ncbi:MAG: Lrp/AsnC ligand binding domain-containing protein [Actinomycetota bacterium]
MSDEQGHPADYTGLHAFVLIDQVAPGTSPEEVVGKLRALGKPPIMYASTFSGEFVAFAHVRARDIRHLQDLMADPIWNAGPRCSWHIESRITAFGAKRKSPGLIALTQVKVRPGKARTVRSAIIERDPPGFVGVSGVSGHFDLLLQMTGSSVEEIEERVEAAVRDIDGVVRTATSFADGDRTEELHGPIPLRDEAS